MLQRSLLEKKRISLLGRTANHATRFVFRKVYKQQNNMEMNMAWDYLNEVGRKIIHLLILLVLVGYYVIESVAGTQAALICLVALLCIFLVLEYLRLELGWRMPFFSAFIRPKEENRMFGVIYFLSASVICLAVFDRAIAITALLMTTFGDLMAAIIGKRFGTITLFRNKTMEGFFACLVTNIAVGIIIVFIAPLNLVIVLLMALVATIIETLCDEMDDNLMVPLFAGLLGQLMSFLL